ETRIEDSDFNAPAPMPARVPALGAALRQMAQAAAHAAKAGKRLLVALAGRGLRRDASWNGKADNEKSSQEIGCSTSYLQARDAMRASADYHGVHRATVAPLIEGKNAWRGYRGRDREGSPLALPYTKF